MSEARKQQAEMALDYLRIANEIELGGEFGGDGEKRELTKDEKNVKESALTSLLEYFVSDPDKKHTTTFGKLKASKSKSRSKRRKPHARGN